MHTQSGYEDARAEGYPDDHFQGLASGPALRIAEQLTIDLMEATGFPVNNAFAEEDIFRGVETLRHTESCSSYDDLADEASNRKFGSHRPKIDLD
jgi:hypothetical protein